MKRTCIHSIQLLKSSFHILYALPPVYGNYLKKITHPFYLPKQSIFFLGSKTTQIDNVVGKRSAPKTLKNRSHFNKKLAYNLGKIIVTGCLTIILLKNLEASSKNKKTRGDCKVDKIGKKSAANHSGFESQNISSSNAQRFCQSSAAEKNNYAGKTINEESEDFLLKQEQLQVLNTLIHLPSRAQKKQFMDIQELDNFLLNYTRLPFMQQMLIAASSKENYQETCEKIRDGLFPDFLNLDKTTKQQEEYYWEMGFPMLATRFQGDNFFYPWLDDCEKACQVDLKQRSFNHPETVAYQRFICIQDGFLNPCIRKAVSHCKSLGCPSKEIEKILNDASLSELEKSRTVEKVVTESIENFSSNKMNNAAKFIRSDKHWKDFQHTNLPFISILLEQLINHVRLEKSNLIFQKTLEKILDPQYLLQASCFVDPKIKNRDVDSLDYYKYILKEYIFPILKLRLEPACVRNIAKSIIDNHAIESKDLESSCSSPRAKLILTIMGFFGTFRDTTKTFLYPSKTITYGLEILDSDLKKAVWNDSHHRRSSKEDPDSAPLIKALLKQQKRLSETENLKGMQKYLEVYNQFAKEKEIKPSRMHDALYAMIVSCDRFLGSQGKNNKLASVCDLSISTIGSIETSVSYGLDG